MKKIPAGLKRRSFATFGVLTLSAPVAFAAESAGASAGAPWLWGVAGVTLGVVAAAAALGPRLRAAQERASSLEQRCAALEAAGSFPPAPPAPPPEPAPAPQSPPPDVRLVELAAAAPGVMFQWVERQGGGCGFAWVSPRSLEMFGVAPERLLEDWSRLPIHPEDMELWRAGLETAASAGVDWEFECRALRGDGLVRWVKGVARPAQVIDGVALNGVLFDFTSERLLREETDRLRNRMDFLLNFSPAIIFAAPIGVGKRPTFISAGVRQFGYEARRLLGENDWWGSRVHPDDRARVLTALDGLGKAGALELSYRFRAADGAWRWVADRRVLAPGGDGRSMEAVGAIVDVTRAAEAERAARRAQERLEMVLQSAGEGIYGVDRVGRVVFVNAAALAMTGFTRAEFLASNAHDLIHHTREDGCGYPVADCPIYRTARDGVARAAGDDVFWRKDGDSFPVEYVAAPLRDGEDEANPPVGAVVVFRDVTEARRIRRELESSLRKWEAVLAGSPVGIVVVDAARRMIRVNGYLTDMLGYREEDMLGRSTRLVLPDDESFARLMDDAYPLLRRGETYRAEMELRRADGRLVWASITGSLVDVTDPATGGVWVIEDISPRKAQEAILEEKTGELERSNAELEAFAYVASHDLRHPLRLVNSYLELLERGLKGALTDETREYLAFARGGAKRMDRLIVDLLEYSRVGRATRPWRRLESAQLVGQALQVLAFAILDADGEVVVGEDLPMVFGDESELERLFVNLIGNAVKYRAPDRPPRIAVSAAQHAEGWLFTVADNGLGIPPEQLERVFGIFQRLHVEGAYEGSGIGLAICRKIVERHGGRIWAESVEGEGSAFHFIVPPAPRQDS